MIDRRRFLEMSGIVAGSLLIGRSALAGAIEPLPFSNVNLTGKLHFVGYRGHLHPNAPSKELYGSSVINTLDLVSGECRQTPLLLSGGHTAMDMGQGRIIVCAHHKPVSLILDSDHNILQTLQAGDKYVYSGHSIIRPNGKDVFILPKRDAKQMAITDYGAFEVYDINTTQKIDEISSFGLQPHEIHTIPGTDEMAVTHYGDIMVPKKPLHHNVVDAKLSIYDANTLAPKRNFSQNEFGALLTHMSVDPNKYAYCVMDQFVDFDPAAGDSAAQIKKAAAELAEILGHEPRFNIPRQSLAERQIAVPKPFLRIDTQTGKREIIMMAEARHLRSQSVVYHGQSAYMIAVYPYSNNLILHKEGHEPEVIDGQTLGLMEMSGAADIPHTPYMAIVDDWTGVAILDMNTRKSVAYYKTGNYYCPHIQFADA